MFALRFSTLPEQTRSVSHTRFAVPRLRDAALLLWRLCRDELGTGTGEGARRPLCTGPACGPAKGLHPGKGARRRRDSASRSICTQRLRRGHPYPLPLLVGYEKINLKCLHPSLTVRSLGIRSLSWQQRNGTSTCPMRRPWLTASAIISVANSMPGQVHMQRDAASRVMPRMPQWKSRTSVWKRQRASAERNFTPRIRDVQRYEISHTGYVPSPL